MSAEFERYLAVAAILFVLGALGFITRRNMIVLMLSAELMLHGVSLTLVTFSRMHGNVEGQTFTIFILTVAACEAGIALALILALYQQAKTLDIEFWTELREAGLPPPSLLVDTDEPAVVQPRPLSFPKLTPAGRVPEIRDENDPNTVSDAASPTADTPKESPDPDDVENYVGKNL